MKLEIGWKLQYPGCGSYAHRNYIARHRASNVGRRKAVHFSDKGRWTNELRCQVAGLGWLCSLYPPGNESWAGQYDVMTPSAARGIVEAIYWKPAIRWVIDRIHVLKPVRFENIRRNELANRVSVNKSDMKKIDLFAVISKMIANSGPPWYWRTSNMLLRPILNLLVMTILDPGKPGDFWAAGEKGSMFPSAISPGGEFPG